MNKAEQNKTVKTHRDHLIFVLYLAGYLVTALYLAYVQPCENLPPSFPNPPDEHARYLIPKFICETGHLPTGFEEAVRVPVLGGSYAFQPILPFIIMGFVMRFLSSFGVTGTSLLFAARCINVLSGLLNAVFLHRLSALFFEKEKTRWLFCFGVLYLPQHLFLHTYVNTESMCMLSITMMMTAVADIDRRGHRYQNCLLFGAGALLCAMTYYNAYGFLAAFGILFLLSFIRENTSGGRAFDRRLFLRYGLPALLLAAVIPLMWFTREAVLLNGDFLGIATNNAMRRGTVVSPAEKGMGFRELFRSEPVFRDLFRSAVAAFGSRSIIASTRYYTCYGLFLVTGFAASLPGLAGLPRADKKTRQYHVASWAATLFTFALWVYYIYRIDYQAQGRYVLPALPVLYRAVCAGYERIAGRLPGKRTETLLYVVLILFLAAALFHYVFKLCRSVYLGTM